ncbi:hypothetical protein C0J50_1352 [Silurus asotus]|uniref:Reverse transcriptase RNase H-like domain-containing protein n=1 Tax=Silurus asotus TaxID=30991 RepID=A0AAD5FCH0_SILAS|nr:hypothetical protein C0J50_1352 [Silurus asotus]
MGKTSLNISQLVHSKQSWKADMDPAGQVLTCFRAGLERLLSGLYAGISITEMWSEYPRGLMWRRSSGFTLDAAAMRPSSFWNCFTVSGWPSLTLLTAVRMTSIRAGDNRARNLAKSHNTPRKVILCTLSSVQSCRREQHLDAELPGALNEPISTNRPNADALELQRGQRCIHAFCEGTGPVSEGKWELKLPQSDVEIVDAKANFESEVWKQFDFPVKRNEKEEKSFTLYMVIELGGTELNICDHHRSSISFSMPEPLNTPGAPMSNSTHVMFRGTTSPLQSNSLRFWCKCSFIEIYNEQIFDLLHSASARRPLREDKKKRVFVQGAVENYAASAAGAYQGRPRHSPGPRKQRKPLTNCTEGSALIRLYTTLTSNSRSSLRWMLPPPVSEAGDSVCLHGCAYFSRKLSAAEQNYDIGNRELLAIKLALEEWQHWLEGALHPFTVITDNKNLQYIREAKRLNTRQARWALFFTRFHYQITYRPGSENGKANSLSRLYGPEEPTEPEPIIPTKLILSPIVWDLEEKIHTARGSEAAHSYLWYIGATVLHVLRYQGGS